MNHAIDRLGRKFVLILTLVTLCAALPAVLSAQSMGTGADGYTRLLWKGTDASISIWLLDNNYNYVGAANFGPYPGEIPAALAVGADNYTRIVWQGTDGNLILWLLDPNLNLVNGYVYGPFPGWVPPDSISLDTVGYERVVWRYTAGDISIWQLAPDGSSIVTTAEFSNPGYIQGGGSAKRVNKAHSMFAENAPATAHAGRLLPKGVMPQAQQATTSPASQQ